MSAPLVTEFGVRRGSLLRIAIGLLILVLTTVVPNRPRVREAFRDDSGPALGAASFSRWQQLELQTRIGFWTGEPSPSVLSDWVDLAQRSRSARIVRRAWAVHAASRTAVPPVWAGPADPTADLPALLKPVELRWWRSLVSDKPVRDLGAPQPEWTRDLPAWLRSGVESRLAEVNGNESVSKSADATMRRLARGSVAPLMAWMAIPALVGIPLLVWAAVVGSGRHRQRWIWIVGLLGLAGAVLAGLVAAGQLSSPLAGVVVGFLVAAAATVPLAFVGLAARVGRPWLRPVDDPTLSARPIPWGVVTECFVAYLAFYLGAQWLAGFVADGARSATIGLALAQALSGIGAIAFTFWRLRSEGLGLGVLGVGRAHWLGDLWSGFAGWAMLSPVVAMLGLISHRLLEDHVSLPPNPVLPLMSRPDPVIRGLLVGTAVVGAPLLEEFFFRGVLFSGIRSRLGAIRAAVAVGVVFATLHPVVDWLPILGLSAGLCWLRHRRASLLPAIVAHQLQNGTASLATLILFG